MRYRGTIAVAVTLLLSLTLSGRLEHQAEAGPYATSWSIVTPQENAHTKGRAQFRINGAETQQRQQAEPTATPVGQTNAPLRRHDPEPLPVEMQRPIAVGLLITFIVVIAVIILHRVRHSRR